MMNSKNKFMARYKEMGEVFDPVSFRLKKSLRVNTIKTTEKKVVGELKGENVKLEKIDFLDWGYYYDAKFSLGAAPAYLLGHYYLQEAASQIAVQVLNPKPEENVLDMAAAPGGKTTQIAQYMKNNGLLIAVEKKKERIDSLVNNIERLSVSNCVVYRKDAKFVKDFGIMFDKILLDAPCMGNYADDRKWFSNRTVDQIKSRVNVQRELLRAAYEVLKKGGILVYSTCSLEPEEDEMNIDWILEEFPDMKVMDSGLKLGDPGLIEVFGKKLNKDTAKCRRFWPHKTGTQGFFVAKLQKN